MIKYILFLMIIISTTSLFGQQIIEFSSNSSFPQLRLVEMNPDKTAKIFWMNNGQPGQKWSLAGKHGSEPNYGLYYNGAFRLLYDEKLELMTNKNNLSLESSSNNEDLNLTFDLKGGSGGTGYGSIYWKDELDSTYAHIRALSDQNNSVIPRHLTLSGGMRDGTGENHLTLWKNRTVIGPNAVEIVDSARLIVAELGSHEKPQLTLHQKNNAGFARLHFKNTNRFNTYSIDASPDRDNPAMRFAYNDFEIMRIIPVITQIGDPPLTPLSGKVGINNSDPFYALELPNVNQIGIGKARAEDWVTYSDRRVKENVNTISQGVEKVMKLNPVEYDHRSSKFNTDGSIELFGHSAHELGFIAQEIYEIIPDVAFKPENESKDLWSISYERIIPVLTRAIQEQQGMIEKLQIEINYFKDKMNNSDRMVKMSKE